MKKQNYWDKFLDFFGLKDEDNSQQKNIEQGQKAKVVSINRNKELEIIFHNPDSFEEARKIIDELKNGKVVVLNLENRERDLARRIIDFLSGGIYGLSGNTQKVGQGVFIFSPNNIKIDGKELEEKINNSIFES